MLRLHGTVLSNYHNTAKLALIEKGLEFEEASVFPSQDPAVVASSPMGKVPWLEVDGRTLTEVNVIFDYLEDTHPAPALYPSDAWERAKAKEIIRYVELYLDATARRHIQTVYFGAPVDQRALEEVRPALEQALTAFGKLVRFEPYVAGKAFGFADIATYFQLGFTNLHTKTIYDWDIIASDPRLADYVALMRERETLRAVDDAMQAALAKAAASR